MKRGDYLTFQKQTSWTNRILLLILLIYSTCFCSLLIEGLSNIIVTMILKPCNLKNSKEQYHNFYLNKSQGYTRPECWYCFDYKDSHQACIKNNVIKLKYSLHFSHLMNWCPNIRLIIAAILGLLDSISPASSWLWSPLTDCMPSPDLSLILPTPDSPR